MRCERLPGTEQQQEQVTKHQAKETYQHRLLRNQKSGDQHQAAVPASSNDSPMLWETTPAQRVTDSRKKK
jgi:hypothetical protein